MKGTRTTNFLFVYLSIALSMALSSGVAQTSVETLVKKFDQYRKNTLQEKLYVHTNQEFYLTGELIWFKVYYVDGSLHHPLDISKVVYVELLDKNNVPVIQTKVPLKNGSGDGSLFLPVAINSGNFTLRAYTHWMKNFSPEFYFQKTITIVNPFIKIDIEKKVLTDQWDAQFFPEGGNMINGVSGKVAFRVIDASGKGTNFNGALINEKNDTLLRFHPSKFGMGHFTFTPMAGSQYRAVLIGQRGYKNIVALPAAKDDGYVLHLKDSSEKLFELMVRAKSSDKIGEQVYLFIHCRQVVSVAKMNTLMASGTQFFIDKNLLAEGISHITLFDSNLQPVCERLYFKMPAKRLSIDIQAKDENPIRGKISLSLTTLDADKIASPSNLSVSVFRQDSLQSSATQDFYSFLWLTSDLQGVVEEPQYYLQEANPEIKALQDLLMLTHGWRRFIWADVLTKDSPDISFVPEYRGHLVKGQVTNESKTPVAGVATYISTPGKYVQLYSSLSNSTGEVNYEIRDFYGTNKVIAHLHSINEERYQINLLSPFSNKFPEQKLPEFQLPQYIAKPLLARTVGMQVQSTFHEETKDRFVELQIDSVPFYGKADETYFLDDYTRFPIMEEVMREYVKGVWVRKNKEGFRFMVFDRLNEVLMRDNPLILLDGVPIVDADKIMEFDPVKVKKIDVFRTKFFLGPITFQGIVSFKTYAADAGGITLEPTDIELNYDGLQLKREFYSPQYNSNKSRESRLPDRRFQLYWSPEVITDKEGKQQIEFYASDMTGTFKVVAEGMNEKGQVGSSSYTFNVKK